MCLCMFYERVEISWHFNNGNISFSVRVTNVSSSLFFPLVWERKAARHPLLLLSTCQQRKKEEEDSKWKNTRQWSSVRRPRAERWKVLLPNILPTRPGLFPSGEEAPDTATQSHPRLRIGREAAVFSWECGIWKFQHPWFIDGTIETIKMWPFHWGVELWGLHLLQQQPVALLWDVRAPALFFCS